MGFGPSNLRLKSVLKILLEGLFCDADDCMETSSTFATDVASGYWIGAAKIQFLFNLYKKNALMLKLLPLHAHFSANNEITDALEL